MGESGQEKTELTPKQLKAIECLLTGATITDAAEKASVGYTTLRRWLSEDEDFKTTFESAKARVFEASVATLQDATDDATKCLREVVNNKKAPAGARVNAAGKIWEYALKARESVETRQILERIEQQLAAAKAAGLLKGQDVLPNAS